MHQPTRYQRLRPYLLAGALGLAVVGLYTLPSQEDYDNAAAAPTEAATAGRVAAAHRAADNAQAVSKAQDEGTQLPPPPVQPTDYRPTHGFFLGPVFNDCLTVANPKYARCGARMAFAGTMEGIASIRRGGTMAERASADYELLWADDRRIR